MTTLTAGSRNVEFNFAVKMTIYSNSNIWVDDLIFLFLMIHSLSSCCDQSHFSVNHWIKSMAHLTKKSYIDDSKAMPQ